MVNPTTLPNIYYKYFPTRCRGICSVDDDGHESEKKGKAASSSVCKPVNPSRLIFLRIPKTGSTTVTALFKSRSKDKSTLVIDVGELEDLVPSLSLGNYPTKGGVQGYHDPSAQATHIRLMAFYRRAASMVLTSHFRGRERMMFHGHFRHYDWTTRAPRLIPQPVSPWRQKLPQFVKDLYGISSPPTAEGLMSTNNNGLGIPTIAFVRRPIDRLTSMYYYDRHSARNHRWRNEFIKQRGNLTLEECLTNTTCLEVNDLKRWCSIQTEMLCGVEPECRRHPLDAKALEIAKRNVRMMLFVGTTERLEESVQFLEETLLPTYLEGLGGVGKVREKVGRVARREGEFSDEARSVLSEICALDEDLYDYVDELLTERVRGCTEEEEDQGVRNH